MKVETDNKYTYETGDIKVKVGDKVIVPVTPFLRDVYGHEREAKVTSLEPVYDGDCEKIIRKVLD